MSIKDKLLASVSAVLILVLLCCMGNGLVRAERTPPDNPIGDTAERLQAETLSGNGGLKGEEDSAEAPAPSAEPSQAPEEEPEPTSEPSPEPSEAPQPSEAPSQAPEATAPPTQGGNDAAGDDTQIGDDQGGGANTDEDGNGTAGDDENGGSGDEGGIGGDAEDEPRIATDLRNRQITLSELPGGVLRFYAYPVGKGENLSVKAVLKNSATPQNGTVLTSPDAINYAAQLVQNETSIITLYLKENGENIAYVRYRISYEADKADEDNPTVGDNPPTIVTNLDGFTGDMKTQDFVFWVRATSNPDGETIYSNQIEVWMDGTLVTKSTGDSRPEYDLHFEPPNRGDYRNYTIKVRAWDGKGNSTMKVYTVRYYSISEGDINGEVTVILDATTVGLGGNLDSETLTVTQGETAASVVIRFLENCSYDVDYSGSATTGCYIRRLERGDMCRRAKVPAALWELILRDGIQTNNNKDRDSLGEFDYTQGSGWVYSINGTVYPGRGLSDQTVSDGDKIYIRFTLAYGKDVGGSGGGKGKLDSYCGAWINGGYQARDHEKYFEETARVVPTATEDGYIEYTCKRCGATRRETLPATGEPIPSPLPPEESPSPSPEKPSPSPGKPSPSPEQPSPSPEQPSPSPEQPSPSPEQPSTERSDPSKDPEETEE